MIILQSIEHTAIVSYIPCIGDIDPEILDATEESEDPINPKDIVGELYKCDELPNNNFCFTPTDFIEIRNNVNDATRHQRTYVAAWKRIKYLEGHKETCTNKNMTLS